MSDNNRILDCGHFPSPHSEHTTGTARTSDGKEICWECAAKTELDDMINTGTVFMYLEVNNNRPKAVANWTGHNRLAISSWKRGGHNIAGSRTDFWFVGPDDFWWHGVQYGQLSGGYYCRCYRTKDRATNEEKELTRDVSFRRY